MKKFIVLVLMMALSFAMVSFVGTSAATVALQKANGTGPVTYRNTSVAVQMPTEYGRYDRDFRAVWATPWLEAEGRYASESSFKSNIDNMLDVLDEYNINALIFHVRTHNNAYYNSDLNPVAIEWRTVDFDVFDPLEYLITETHKRGIEFHAWMNPYRIDPGRYGEPLPAANPAQSAANSHASGSVRIFDPGLPLVRDFLIDTVVEFLDRYDADAIHFDDYFYADLGNSSNIVLEPDQSTYLTYKPSHYGANSNIDKANWRREQIDIFIRDLYSAMRSLNIEQSRFVQLGISPTGIYRNGNAGAEGGALNYDANGNFITTGSNTAGYAHYGAPLYADTKKWIEEEWIDYILPQSYWSFEQTAASFADVMDWWANVVRYTNVNLYSGMGIYMDSFSWGSNPQESANQVLYTSKHPEIQGHAVYRYGHMKAAMNPNNSKHAGLETIRTDYWAAQALRPVLRTYEGANLPAPSSTNQVANSGELTLQWSRVTGARGYVIYRAQGAIDINNLAHRYAITGFSNASTMEFVVEDADMSYNYAVVPVDGSSRLGQMQVFAGEGEEVSSAKIQAAQAKIDLIPAPLQVTLEHKGLVTEARMLFDALNATEKSFITNASRITNAETRIASLEAQLEIAQGVIDQIDALPIPDNITLSDQEDVALARAAYNALSSTQKSLVSNLDMLIAREAKITLLLAMQERIDQVIGLIENLPDVADIVLTDKAAVEAARAAFTELSQEEQAQVTNIDELDAAQAKIAQLEDPTDPTDPTDPEEPSNPIDRLFGCNNATTAFLALMLVGLVFVFRKRKA